MDTLSGSRLKAFELLQEPLPQNFLRTKKAHRMFFVVKKRSIKKEWSVKKFNIYVLYRVIYGRNLDEDKMKHIIVFYSFYWLDRKKRFRSIKDIITWLKMIDLETNGALILCSGHLPIKHLYLEKILPKRSRLRLNKYLPNEAGIYAMWQTIKGRIL